MNFTPAFFLLVFLLVFLLLAQATLVQATSAELLEIAKAYPASKNLRRLARAPYKYLQAVFFYQMLLLLILGGMTAAILADYSISLGLGILISLAIWIALALALSLVVVRALTSGRRASRLRMAAGILRVAMLPTAWLLTRALPEARSESLRSVGDKRELMNLVEEASAQKVLSSGTRDLIESVLDFDGARVSNLMLPRSQMITAEADAKLEEVRSLFLETGISRIPILAHNPRRLAQDEVLGVLYLKDLFAVGDKASRVNELVRPAFLVPKSLSADRLLRRMQDNNRHLAVAIDEYGDVAGLITLEDLMEELVGQIEDEYDQKTPDILEVAPGRYWASGHLGLDELEEVFDLRLACDEVNSLGGFLAKKLDRLPRLGDTIEEAGLRFSVAKVSGSRGKDLSILIQKNQGLSP